MRREKAGGAEAWREDWNGRMGEEGRNDGLGLDSLARS